MSSGAARKQTRRKGSLKMINKFIESISQSASFLLRNSKLPVVVFHHNDSDGLSSGAILSTAFDRLGIRFSSYCLEKTYPEAFEKVFSDPFLAENATIIIADFGSGILPELSKLNAGRRTLIVLDHHFIQSVADPSVQLINPLSFGINGSVECSASSICFLFALALDNLNLDLAPLGCLGAFADGHYSQKEGFSGVNQLVFERASKAGLVRISENKLQLKSSAVFQNAQNLKAAVDALGSIGYFEKGPDIALKGLRDGFDERYHATAEIFLARFESDMQKVLELSLRQYGNWIQYFSLDELFLNTGVKTVGLVCERLLETQSISPARYLLGFQPVPARIPGLGELPLSGDKISYRIPASLWKQIESKKMPALTEIVPRAAQEVGGTVDGCHRHAAATLLSSEKRDSLLKAFEEGVERWCADREYPTCSRA